MSPEAAAAFAAFEVLSKWLPAEVGPAANLGLQLARRALENEQDPAKYMRDLLEAEAQRSAKEKFG